MTTEIPTQNIPKTVSATITSVRGDSFVVREGLLNNFYALKVARDTGHPILRIEKAPPIIREGIAVVKKKFYHVTVADLLRGVIRKSRELNLRENQNGSTTAPIDTVARVDQSNEAVLGADQSGTGRDPFLEESQLADAAFEEQVGALLDLVHSKEGFEYEVTDSLQSGRIDESGTIQDPDSDIELG